MKKILFTSLLALAPVFATGDIVNEKIHVTLDDEFREMANDGRLYPINQLLDMVIEKDRTKLKKDVAPETEAKVIGMISEFADKWQSKPLYSILYGYYGMKTETDEEFEDPNNLDRKKSVEFAEKCFALDPVKCDYSFLIQDYYRSHNNFTKRDEWLRKGSELAKNGYVTMILGELYMEGKDGYKQDKVLGMAYMKKGKQIFDDRGYTELSKKAEKQIQK